MPHQFPVEPYVKRLNLQPELPYSVKDGSAVGDGQTDDTNAIYEAARKVGTSGTIVFPAGEYRVTENLTLNCAVIFLYGASLDPDSGVTVTLAGPVETAPGGSVRSATAQGTVNVTGPLGGAGTLDVRAFGAVGDGVTDDTAAIQAAIDAAETKGGGVVVGDAASTYRITSGITIDANNVVLDLHGGTIDADFASGWAVTVGSPALSRFNLGIKNAYVRTSRGEATLNGVRFSENVRRQVSYELLRIRGFGGIGIQFQKLNWSLQQSVAPLVEWCGTGVDIGPYSNAVTVAGLGVSDCTNYGVTLRGAISVTFVGGYIQFCGVGGVSIVEEEQLSVATSFFGTYFEDNTVSHIVGNGCRGLTVVGCWMDNNSMSGPCIQLINWDGAHIVGNSPANLSVGTQRDFVEADANCTLINVGYQNVISGLDQQVSVTGGSVVGLINGGAKRYSTTPTANTLSVGSTIMRAGSGTDANRAVPFVATVIDSGTFAYRRVELFPVKQASVGVTSPYTPNLVAAQTFDITVPNTGLTINAPTGPYADGDLVTFLMRQNSTGGGAVTWDAAYATDYSDTGNSANRYASVAFRWAAGRSRWVQVSKLSWVA